MNELIGIIAERKAMVVEGVNLPHARRWYKPGGQIHLFDAAAKAAVYAAKLEDRPENVMGIKYWIAPADVIDMLNEVGSYQASDKECSEYGVCPRCGNKTLKPNIEDNAVSRRANIMICGACGTAEALEDISDADSSELIDWAVFQREWEDDSEL